MDFNDEREDLTDDGRAAAHRERATAMLPEIAQQVKEALTGERIDTSVFFLVPNSGDAIITFGSAVDLPDAEWGRVADVVASTVRQSIGFAGTRCREVVCATTDAVADHPRPSEISPVDWTLQRSGAENR